MSKSHITIMDLREPKKKKRVRRQPQASLPISTNDDGEWRIYTAHLSACGTCIVDPNEMEAVYSMGFFGKGSLSRSFPSFGRRRFGAPPIVRNRQWIRRQKWLQELENLNRDAKSQESEDFEMSLENEMDENSPSESVVDESFEEKDQESNLEGPAELEKIIVNESEKKCSLKLIEKKKCDNKDPESRSKVLVDLTMTQGKDTDDDFPIELKTDLPCDKKFGEASSKAPEVLEKIDKNESNKDDSVEKIEEIFCDIKYPKFGSKDLVELEKTTEKEIDNVSLVELKTDLGDRKSQELDSMSSSKLAKTIVNEIDENSSIEFFTGESCVKRARMGNAENMDVIEIANGNNGNEDESLVIYDESINVDEVLLDSNEEEICEIDEKSTNDANHEICEIVEKSTNEAIEEICEVAGKTSNDANEEISKIIKKRTNEAIEKICDVAGKSTNEAIEKRQSPTYDETCILSDAVMGEKVHDFSCNDEDNGESIIEDETNLFEVLVLPDTDSDTENYLKNVKSRIEKEGFPVNETLHLTFEETFFLMYGLGCLQLIHYDGSVFSINNAWNHFQQQDQYFIQKYVIYHYFRSKGWVVKPGLKFGGDFLLYKQGPPFYHASYIVIIEVMDADTLIRDDVKSPRKITWKNLIGLERLSETIAKEILFAQILWPSSIVRNGTLMPVEALSEFTVRELLWRRWDPKRKIDNASMDEEDSDST